MKVMINCAMSVDGKIALPTRKQTAISNCEDMERVHRMRNEADAILVGIGTVLSDDPKLTVSERHVKVKKQPLRVVLDSKGRTPENAEVLNGAAKTLIATNEGCTATFRNASVFRAGKARVDLRALMDHLQGIGIGTLMVEGGESVIWSFIEAGLVDEITVFVGSMVIGGRASPTMAGGEGFKTVDSAPKLVLRKCKKLGDGVLLRYDVVR